MTLTHDSQPTDQSPSSLPLPCTDLTQIQGRLDAVEELAASGREYKGLLFFVT